MLFHIPAPAEVDVVVIGMTSKRDIRLIRPRYDVITWMKKVVSHVMTSLVYLDMTISHIAVSQTGSMNSLK